MKTINWSKSHLNDFEPQKHSSRNIFPLWGHIVKKLEKVGDRWAKLGTDTEPKIWKKKDSDGNTYYRVYDRLGDRYHYFNSKDEVRWWLDKYYYL